MRPTDMHRLAHAGCHVNGPKDWRQVPVVTGDYDFDATIMHRNNKDMPKRLSLYVKTHDGGYGPRTNYDSFGHRYSGDD